MTWIGIVLLIFVYLVIGGVIGIVITEDIPTPLDYEIIPACVLVWPMLLILFTMVGAMALILNISRVIVNSVKAIVKFFKSIKWCCKEEVEDDLEKVKRDHWNIVEKEE